MTFGNLNRGVDASATLDSREFSFSGNAKEYFGIWIVNLLLSIITLGIYTAWAKVRRLRYFYGNTWLDGHNFEYHAKPVQILIGRIIVVAVLLIVNIVSNFFPFFALFVLIPYMIGLPWLLNKAISFNARVTSYRNVHFNFEGSYGAAFAIFILLPLSVPVIAAAVISGLLYTSQPGFAVIGILVVIAAIAQLAIIPIISKKTNEYIGNRTRYGSAKFSTELELGELFKNIGIVALCAGVPFALIVGSIVASYFSGGALVLAAGLSQVALISVYFIIIAGGVFYAAGVRNVAFNGTNLDGGHKLHSNLSRTKYTFIIITNFLAIIVSIGLLRPWTAVRTWRYLMDNSALQVAGSLDDFIAGQEEAGNVVAGEYLDIEGIDFGL